ncbi:hypothetical protein KPP03845_200138 (plasmid) [Streptomyces xanthophaeus]|nr:hypothetical protein KPP03845_200138 [Streptomyces xanthophaeus]
MPGVHRTTRAVLPAGEEAGASGVRVPYGSGRQPVVRAGLPQDAGGKGRHGGGARSGSPPHGEASANAYNPTSRPQTPLLSAVLRGRHILLLKVASRGWSRPYGTGTPTSTPGLPLSVAARAGGWTGAHGAGANHAADSSFSTSAMISRIRSLMGGSASSGNQPTSTDSSSQS